MSSEKLHDHTAKLYKDLKLLKFRDIVYLKNCLLISQIEQNENLAKSILELKYYGYNHKC